MLTGLILNIFEVFISIKIVLKIIRIELANNIPIILSKNVHNNFNRLNECIHSLLRHLLFFELKKR